MKQLTLEERLARLKKVPISELTTTEGKDIVQVFRDRYFIVLVENGETYALFTTSGSPQCNGDIRIAESIRDKCYPNLGILHVEEAFIPVKIYGDFDYKL